MQIPEDLRYTKEHEWVRVEGKIATVGITDYAQDQLGDVVYVELPEEGEGMSKGDTAGVVESVKAVSDVYAPLSGEVTEINVALKESPETINTDCYGEAWMMKVELSNLDEVDELLTPTQYAAFVAEESE
ncbi:MAG: glycine cleavage system protein GcvH [Deltaproteobacteria bacterium]|nr:glycine cleavage system protein GcvH [Deltaproteobacteria bacterium]